MLVSPEHTHTAAFYWGLKRIFWRQSCRRRSASLPEPNPEPGALSKPSIGYVHSARAARRRAVLFAHLKCAPVRRALSATDSVCSLLQDGGSAPIHFLLIASQLSLSIRLKTHRFPAQPPGMSYSISSLTNGAGRGGSGRRVREVYTYRSSGGCEASNGGCSDHRRGALCVCA